MRNTCLTHARNMPETCPKHIRNMPAIYPKHVRNMPSTFPKHRTRYIGHILKTCPTHARTRPNAFPRDASNIPGTCPKHRQHIAEISPHDRPHCQTITTPSLKHRRHSTKRMTTTSLNHWHRHQYNCTALPSHCHNATNASQWKTSPQHHQHIATHFQHIANT